MSEVVVRIVLTVALFGVIEMVDGAVDGFSLHWLISLSIAAVVVFGGWLIIVDSDGAW
jgi:hypothetical protein